MGPLRSWGGGGRGLAPALASPGGQRAGRYRAEPGLLAEDLAQLTERGYLTIASPAAFGGMGLTLPQVACAQRRLAYHAPAAALAVNAHHAWVGAAAGVHAGGEASADWLLREAAQGRLFAGPGGAADDLVAAEPASPGWDWLGVRAVDGSEPMRPRILHAFIRRSRPRGPAGPYDGTRAAG
jgi:hypothetical protein